MDELERDSRDRTINPVIAGEYKTKDYDTQNSAGKILRLNVARPRMKNLTDRNSCLGYRGLCVRKPLSPEEKIELVTSLFIRVA